MTRLRSLDIDQVFYYSALLFALILSLSRAGISFFLLWFILLFLLKNDFQNKWLEIKTNPALKAMGLFLAFIFISIFWSTDLYEAINQIRLYSYWILIPIFAVSLKKKWLPNLITAFLLGMFINEILVYGIFFDFWKINGSTHSDPSPFMNHIQYSVLLATTAIILLNRLLSKHYTFRKKIPILIFFLTTTINLFISGGRTGQVAFFITIALTIMIHYRVTAKALFIFLILNTILFVGAYITLPTYNQRIQDTIFDIKAQQNGIYFTSVGLRNGFYIIAIDAFKNAPLFGAGVGDYKLATIKALSQDKHHFEATSLHFFSLSDYHNQYLMILIQTGLIGFMLMLWLIITLYRLTINDNEYKNLSVLTLTVFLISALSESLWIAQFPIVLFIFIVSISLVASKHNLSSKI